MTQMTVVELRIGQKVRLGDDVVVMISDVAQKRCSLGIKAPHWIKILRSELVEEACGQPQLNETVSCGGSVQDVEKIH